MHSDGPPALHTHPVNHSRGRKRERQPPPASIDGSVVATTRGGAATVAKADLYDKAFIGAAARDVSLLNDR